MVEGATQPSLVSDQCTRVVLNLVRTYIMGVISCGGPNGAENNVKLKHIKRTYMSGHFIYEIYETGL